MSAKDCRRQESVKYQLISTARPHGLKRKIMLPKILSENINHLYACRHFTTHIKLKVLRSGFSRDSKLVCIGFGDIEGVRYVFSNSSREIRYRLCHVLISIIRNAFHYGWNKTRYEHK